MYIFLIVLFCSLMSCISFFLIFLNIYVFAIKTILNLLYFLLYFQRNTLYLFVFFLIKTIMLLFFFLKFKHFYLNQRNVMKIAPKNKFWQISEKIVNIFRGNWKIYDPNICHFFTFVYNFLVKILITGFIIFITKNKHIFNTLFIKLPKSINLSKIF